MLTSHLALVSEVQRIPLPEVTVVAAALQKQVTRDLAPIWSVDATVSAFARVEDVPVGYWLVTVAESLGQTEGSHLDKDGQPYAVVEPSEHWSLTASHECLEMLVDPQGDRLIAGPSVKPDQGRVEYLLEVCDPSQDPAHGYTVDGILVSDFYTPSFFDPVAASGVRYSFTGAIPAPRQIVRGGYLSWHDPASDHWWQDSYLREPKEDPRDLGVVERAGQSVRAMIDRLTPGGRSSLRRPDHPAFAAASRARAHVQRASQARAAAWRRHRDEASARRGEGG